MTNSELEFGKVERLTAYEQVAGQIRAAILDRSLAADARLPPERELALQFGVSRTTVREALRHLQAQGLLAPKGRTSPMLPADPNAALARFREALSNVVQLRNVSLHELLELRLALETAALVRAAQSPVVKHLEEARAALEAMENPRLAQEAFYEADVDFHAALVAASGNEALRLVMLAVKDSIRGHLDRTMHGRSFLKVQKRVRAEHRQLLVAVEEGNAQGVAALLQKHLEFYGT
jgi:GntR family transcriptional regulator, transcriptional repressor for pyruvate dehydrogenase complex